METKSCIKVHKLSEHNRAAAIDAAQKELQQLKRLLSGAAELSEELAYIRASFRKGPPPEKEPFLLTADLQENEHLLRVVFRDCSDILYRKLRVGKKLALLVYAHGLTDEAGLAKNVIQPLSKLGSIQTEDTDSIVPLIENTIYAAGVQAVQSTGEVLEEVMSGHTLLLLDGFAQALLLGMTQFAKRSIGDSKSEGVIRGAHEAFNETLADNIGLLRRRSKDANLKTIILTVGRKSKTRVCLVYVGNLVKPDLLDEVERRIQNISTDIVLASYRIEEAISSHPWSPFPQAELAERPDSILTAVYNGRVGVLVDGTPFAFVVPSTYYSAMQAVDDYTAPPLAASLIRLVRHLSAFIAIYLPSIYIAIISYHPGMLPTTLAISIAELRAKTPFPSILEVLAMVVVLEIFQEAIVRIPEKIVTAVSVLGSFVIGTTVVEAGLINPLLVVVMAITAIASYTAAYNLNIAFRVSRVMVLILASILGLYGVMLGLLGLTIHLCSLHSFGESYIGGVFDITLMEDWKDTLIRLPYEVNPARPKVFGAQDRTKGGDRNA